MMLRTPESAKDVIRRARMCIAQRIRYQLEGVAPWLPSELPRIGQLGNCTIFEAWCYGLSIKSKHPFHQRNGGWLNSTMQHHDVRTDGGIFTQLQKAAVGCFVVYPWKNDQAGHAAIVTEVTADGRPKTIIDCSPANGRHDSVRERAYPGVFKRPDTVYGWYTGIRSGV